jgi:hypothetical protein
MRKNNQLRSKSRIRTDKSMLIVGLFSLAGGWFVFTSYAAQKPATTKPGVVSLQSLPKKGVYYKFSLNSKLKYCFEDPQQHAKLTVYSSKELLAQFNIESGCFSPKQSYSNAIISITGVRTDSKLKITNK